MIKTYRVTLVIEVDTEYVADEIPDFDRLLEKAYDGAMTVVKEDSELIEERESEPKDDPSKLARLKLALEIALQNATPEVREEFKKFQEDLGS